MCEKISTQITKLLLMKQNGRNNYNVVTTRTVTSTVVVLDD